MRSGMKMMAVNEMRRRRDSRGRFMEGGSGGQMEMGYGRMEGGQMNEGNYNRMEGGGGRNRMEGGNSNRMGGYARMEGGGGSGRMESEMRGGMQNEMRRGGGRGGNRSEGGNSSRMEEGGASSHYWPGPIPPPYGGEEMEMRGGGGRGGERRNNYDEGPSMGGYGGFIWDEDVSDNRMEGGSNIVDMRQYGRRYNPDRPRMTMGGQDQQRMIGFSSFKGDEEHLSREEAEKWVKGMKSEDGKTGGRWSYQEIKQYASNFGIEGEEKVVEFFAVMNALATDYGKVAKKHGVDKVDFWADMSKAFIHDKDANPGKVKMYYECIAKKDDD